MPMEVFTGITMDPGIRFGKPRVADTRIDVATIVGAMAAGESWEGIAESYGLSTDQVRAAIRYAAHLADHAPPAVQEVSRSFS